MNRKFKGTGIGYSPHGYQSRIQSHIVDGGSVAVWAEMGLGKTVATLTAVGELLDRVEARKVLVVAPKRVAEHTWPAEIRKWNHIELSYAVISGNTKQRARIAAGIEEVHIIGRDNLHWLVDAKGKSWNYDIVVIDESSGFKDSSTRRFKSLRKVRGSVDRIVELTGTPSPNSLMDLWAQIFLLDGGERLGRTLTSYRDAFFDSDYMGYSYTIRKGAEKRIYELLDDIAVSLRVQDWLELPERIDLFDEVYLDEHARQKYQDFEKDALLQFSPSELVVADNAAVLAGKLLQAASGFVYNSDKEPLLIHDHKLDALAEILEASTGEPVLVAYTFTADVDRIKKIAPKARVLKNSADIDAWNRGEIPVLLAHPASAGHGLNLQAGGARIVWFTLPWSLELYQQFNARLHRQGQTKPVMVHHLIAQGTIDEHVRGKLEGKAASQDELLDFVKFTQGGATNGR